MSICLGWAFSRFTVIPFCPMVARRKFLKLEFVNLSEMMVCTAPCWIDRVRFDRS